jgi:uncharacterized protein involved in exopolysaccharide biosynthesis
MTQATRPTVPGRAPDLERSVLPGEELATGGDVSLLGVMNVVLRHRVSIVLIAFLAAASLAAYALTRPRTYTSIASFMPQVRQTAGSGLAAQLGMILPGADVSESPQFYVDLLRSREILGSAVDSVYRIRNGSVSTSVDLVTLYGGEEENLALRRDRAIARLSELLSTGMSARTGVVTVKVAAYDPSLAQSVTQRLIDLLGEFNLRPRQTRARAERRFSEERLQAVRAELRTAEDRLQYFMQSNRDYRNAPALYLQGQRLESDVALLRQVVITLQQATEQAKIDEVRDTPTITVVETPSFPVRRDGRGTLKALAIGGLLGLVIGVALAFVRELLSRPEIRGSTEYEEFAELRRDILYDVRHPLRALARAATGSRRRR